jgi:hypothetical protein
MASEAADFAGASWQTYATVPMFRLSVGSGARKIYFKVKDDSIGEESPAVSSTIALGGPGFAVAAWGFNVQGECNVPMPNSGFVAVTAAGNHSLGLKSDGTILAWGSNGSGQCDVPAPNGDFVAVDGSTHSLVVSS